MRRTLALFALPILAGLAAAVVALARYDEDPPFAAAQRQPRLLEAAQLEKAVASAPEPVPGDRGRPGVSADCSPSRRPKDFLRNPWRCRVRYRDGRTIEYAVRVQPNGSYRGISPGATRLVYGRVALPPLG